MRETLLMRAESVAGDDWRWFRLDSEGRPREAIHAGTLADAAAEAAGMRVVVLVSGSECLLTRVTVPGRNRQKLLRAVPYALEEQLSDEVENLHFALGEQHADGSWPVAVISRAEMDALTAALAAVPLDVQQLVPEQLAVPWQDGEISVLVHGDVCLVRSAASDGYVVDTENLDAMLGMAAAEGEVPRLRIYIRDDVSPPETDNYAAEAVLETSNGDPLNLFAVGLAERPLNLLQGSYSRSGDWSRIWKPLRSTAALLLVGVLVSLIAAGFNYVRLGKESAQLQAEVESIFREASPETRRIVNPRVQLQQLLDALQTGGAGDTSFLVLLGKTGKILGGVQGVELGAVSFRSGRLDLDMKITDLQSLDQLKQSLSSDAGLSVEIQSATTDSDQRVQSRLRIQGGGA